MKLTHSMASAMANKIRQARIEAGLTQVELAERMGTSQESVSRAECAHVEPSLSYLLRVAEATGNVLVLPHFGTI